MRKHFYKLPMIESSEIINKSFNQDFCNHLEYHLSRTFRNSIDNDLKSMWCDGVLMPEIENQLTEKSILETRKIRTKAFIGNNGQGKYEMIIKLGPQSIDSCLKGFSLIACLPDEDSSDWVTIDMQGNVIELQLN